MRWTLRRKSIIRREGCIRRMPRDITTLLLRLLCKVGRTRCLLQQLRWRFLILKGEGINNGVLASGLDRRHARRRVAILFQKQVR